MIRLSHIRPLLSVACIVAMLAAIGVYAYADTDDPDFNPPPAIVTTSPLLPSGGTPLVDAADSIMMPFPVQQTVPRNYEDILKTDFAADLDNPSNVTTLSEYDPVTGCYIVRTRVGETEIVSPFYLTPEQYNA